MICKVIILRGFWKKDDVRFNGDLGYHKDICFASTTLFSFVARGCLYTFKFYIVTKNGKEWLWCIPFHSTHTHSDIETVKTLICQLNTIEGTHVLMVQRILPSVLLASNIVGGIIAYHLWDFRIQCILN